MSHTVFRRDLTFGDCKRGPERAAGEPMPVRLFREEDPSLPEPPTCAQVSPRFRLLRWPATTCWQTCRSSSARDSDLIRRHSGPNGTPSLVAGLLSFPGLKDRSVARMFPWRLFAVRRAEEHGRPDHQMRNKVATTMRPATGAVSSPFRRAAPHILDQSVFRCWILLQRIGRRRVNWR